MQFLVVNGLNQICRARLLSELFDLYILVWGLCVVTNYTSPLPTCNAPETCLETRPYDTVFVDVFQVHLRGRCSQAIGLESEVLLKAPVECGMVRLQFFQGL